jgi:hypothetical protein
MWVDRRRGIPAGGTLDVTARTGNIQMEHVAWAIGQIEVAWPVGARRVALDRVSRSPARRVG